LSAGKIVFGFLCLRFSTQRYSNTTGSTFTEPSFVATATARGSGSTAGGSGSTAGGSGSTAASIEAAGRFRAMAEPQMELAQSVIS